VRKEHLKCRVINKGAGLRMQATLCVLSCSASQSPSQQSQVLYQWHPCHPDMPSSDQSTAALNRFDFSSNLTRMTVFTFLCLRPVNTKTQTQGLQPAVGSTVKSPSNEPTLISYDGIVHQNHEHDFVVGTIWPTLPMRKSM
jgi:hypothetical protein